MFCIIPSCITLLSCASPDGKAAKGPITIESRGDAPASATAPEAHSTPAILAREPWTFHNTEGEVLRTRHYRLYTTEESAATRDRTALFLERALSHYRTALTPLPAPPVKLDTYVMATRPQWERASMMLMGQQAEDLLAIQRGGFASRGIGVYYNLGFRDTLAIAAHEGWHQYTQRTFPDALPAWLEEGLATYMEGHRWSHDVPLFMPWANTERFDALRSAHAQDELIPLADLMDARPQDFLTPTNTDILRYYAQVWALTQFLVEGADGAYRDPLARALNDAAAGRLSPFLTETVGDRAALAAMARRAGPAVALAYFNPDLDALQAEFDDFVARIVATGSRDAIVAGKSPLAAP